MDENTRDPLKSVIQEWINERHQALLEQVMMTWQEGLGRLVPDEGLLEKIQEAAAPEDLFPESSGDMENELGVGLDLLDGASSQGEVLKHLLDGLQPFVERSALFVVKQGIANLYATRGFESDAPRPGVPVVPPPALEALLQGEVTSLEGAGPAYGALLGVLSKFEASDIRVHPLHLRRKVVALVLVDSGLRQIIDHPNHVRALVRAAEARLSFLAGQKEEEKEKHIPADVPASMMTQRIPETIQESPAPALDPKVRTNAERSARVLVGDIELYFPAKVAQGRQQGNLYGLLRDELDRSRASFMDRYGAEVEEQHRIFYLTVVQQLCEGDAAKLGAAPWVPRN